MATQPVPNLIQGVSQQAAQQRRDTQCEDQLDCFNSVADGAGARPCAEVVKVWPSRVLTGAFFTEIIRGEENYAIGVYNAAPFGINLDTGVDAAITGSNADGYLDASALSPRDQFRAQVVEDTTFIINRDVAPIMDPAIVSPAVQPAALVFCRSGAYDTFYQVKLSGPAALTASYTTPSGSSDAWEQANSLAIANDLRADINGNSGYLAVQSGSSFKVSRGDNADFDIETVDGNGDEYLYGFKDRVTAYSKLPARGFDGFTIAVQGESRTAVDDFYVRFTGPSATGTWMEIVQPGIKTTLKKTTMPHTFTLTGPNAFTYGSRDWSTRIAGDEKSAKDPSFVGKKIRDVFYHQNRLGLLYSGGAVWSKSRFPFTYFPDTVQTVLATAPVDIALVAAGTSRGAAEMDFAVQIDESLFLWATRAQFRVSSGQDPFKQDTVEAPPSTAYEYSTGCNPLALGSYLYFPTDVGPYATMRSVRFQTGKPGGDILVTAHVSKYIPSGVRWLAGSDTHGCVFVVSDGEPDAIFLYNLLVQQDEFLQSAWNKWRIPGGPILWASLRNNELRILQQRPEGVALLKFNLTPKVVDPVAGAKYATRLDMRVSEAQVTGLAYMAGTNTTAFVLPYKPTGPDLRVIVREDKPGGYSRGREFKVTDVTNYTVTVEGNLTGYKFYAGQRISARRLDSRFYVRNEKGILDADRLTVNTYTVEFADTGYTRIEVATPNKPTRSYGWEGRTAGLPGSDLGPPVIGTDKLTASVSELAENAEITLVNDSFLPSHWQSASYDYTAIGKAGQK
ncbi:phage nozzle protein [Aminobacter sp. HY435]|uniref:phage nozzle protein n=1 Tax=Aminobacter sp. HY435 TaxID=2970917 RepID=UPI0022B943F7|nr:hypothetical protein [Aminobacter sp. HY435]